MAIQVDLATSQYGVPFAGAYFRIVTAAISRTRNAEARFSVMLDVAGYATAPQDEDTRDVDFRRYHTPLSSIEAMSGTDFLSKCYAWVMSQDDMDGAVPA
jgi:hypothetical protein